MKSLSLSEPHAIVMVGMPGSGKSFFASKFAETFGAPLVDIEQISPLATSREAAVLLAEQQVTQLAKTHASIVLELDTSTRTNRAMLTKRLKESGYTTLLVWVQIDVETAKQRVMKAKSADESEFDAKIKQFSSPHSSEHPLVISGKHTYASQAKIVLKRLSEPRAHISTHKQPVARTKPRGQNIIIR